MFYRVIADLMFTDPDEAADFYHDCELAFPKSTSINLGSDNPEPRNIRLERCYHDEDPTKPCEPIQQQVQ